MAEDIDKPVSNSADPDSARRATDEERSAFREAAAGLRQAKEQPEPVAYLRHDRKLNLLLSRAVHNDFIANAWASTWGLSRRFWVQHYRSADDLVVSAELLAKLCIAVADGNEDAAVTANDKLLDYVEDFTRATLDE